MFGLLVASCDRDAGDTAQPEQRAEAVTGTIDPSNAGALMPAVLLTDPEGKELNTGALQGEPVLINLWATWCAPCVKEMPLLDDLAADYDGKVRVLTVSQDMGSSDKIAAFFEQGGYRMLEPWHDPDNALGFALGDTMLPMTILYDASGQEVWRVMGDFDWAGEEARTAIDEGVL